MPEKVLFSLRLVETDDGYRVETEGAVPGEAFAAPGFARMAFALGDDDLAEGVQRIADLLAK